MFSVNKETRSFIQTNLIAVRNGYINGGLIEYELKLEPKRRFNSYYQLEKLYFEAIKRNTENRIITIKITLEYQQDLMILNEVINYMKT